MISPRALASATLVALGVVAGPAAALAAPAPTAAHESTLRRPNDATVTALRVEPASGKAEVVIRVDGAVTIKHFVLTHPDKIVVDLTGATLGSGMADGDAYDGVARGGITRIRYSQFTRSVVRVVLTLDAPHTYDVTQTGSDVRVSVDAKGTADSFGSWAVGDATNTSQSAAADDARPTASSAASSAASAATSRPTSDGPAPQMADRDVALAPVVHKSKPATPVSFAAQQSQEPRITVNWENSPISDVLGVFAAFTGRTILPSKNVTGTVTANIVNLPWDVALKEVMNANGYDVTVNPDGVIVVDTFESIAARQATIPLTTRTVRLNYARANAVKDMVKERLSRNCPQTAIATGGAIAQPIPGAPTAQPVPTPPTTTMVQSLACPQRGTVTADTITNSISITDVPQALSDLEAYARSLDLRQPQVNIKAKIILVDRSTLEGLGLRYDLGTPQQFFNDIVPRTDSLGNPLTTAGQILLGGNTLSAIANATARVPNAALQLVYSTALGNFDFTTFLEALQTNSLVDVQAEPSASVLNNRTANLTAGTQVPIRVIDAGAGGNQTSNFPRANVAFQQTGVILTVTPQITANRQIQMKVHVENSDVQFESNDVGAVFPTQKVDNEVLVADGETAVMGGLTQSTINVTRTGLPLLIDLPVIGRLFGVTQRQEEKRDLLILITPHIIDDGQMPSDGGAGRP